jgi:hypothetical protein
LKYQFEGNAHIFIRKSSMEAVTRGVNEDGRIIRKLILKKQDLRLWTEFKWPATSGWLL